MINLTELSDHDLWDQYQRQSAWLNTLYAQSQHINVEYDIYIIAKVLSTICTEISDRANLKFQIKQKQ